MRVGTTRTPRAGRRLKRAGGLVLAVALLGAVQIVVAAPPDGVISLAHRSVSWSGSFPLAVNYDASTCLSSTCADFSLGLDIPSAFWARKDGGIVVRLDWPSADDELDLYVFDSSGKEVGKSFELHTKVEQLLIQAPAPGVYRVHVVGIHAVNVVYRMRAWVVYLNDHVAATSPTTMRFAAPTFVDPQIWAAMPSVWSARDGATYVAAPWNLAQLSTLVWRSLDGGRTFRLLPQFLAPGVVEPLMRPCLSAGGGDADVITDRTGRVYFDDLWSANAAVGVSPDRGETWSCHPAASSTFEIDRPWLAPAPSADGPGGGVDAYLASRDGGFTALVPVVGAAAKPVAEHLDFTTDGGRTWRKGATYAVDAVGFTGPLFTASDGTLYQVLQHSSSVFLARSTDLGRTMKVFKVSDRIGTPNNQWLGGDVDAAGNVYVAWVDQGTWDVLYSVSRDKGASWSTPLRVNPPASETAAMPWVAAGKAGDVAIGWYGGSGNFYPELAPAAARWYAWVARSANANSPSPRFEIARMSETPVRFGSMCITGFGCTLSDRKMGDFFEMDIAPDGAIVASFADTARIQKTIDGYKPSPYDMVARQISGLGMSRSSTVLSEPSGDAFVPERMTGADAASLDLIGLPRTLTTKGGFRVSFKLASAKNLTGALTAHNLAVATDAFWLVLWKANDRVEYAGLRVDRNGVASFFGGDEPVSIGRPDTNTKLADKMASYPATFPLAGSVDPATGQVSIDVPLGAFHLRKGDLLHSVQAFTMTALTLNGRRTFLQPMLVVDVAPAQTLRIG